MNLLPPHPRCYAPPAEVKVPPQEYLGPPPSGRSTLTSPGSAAEPPAMRWEEKECGENQRRRAFEVSQDIAVVEL